MLLLGLYCKAANVERIVTMMAGPTFTWTVHNQTVPRIIVGRFNMYAKTDIQPNSGGGEIPLLWQYISKNWHIFPTWNWSYLRCAWTRRLSVSKSHIYQMYPGTYQTPARRTWTETGSEISAMMTQTGMGLAMRMTIVHWSGMLVRRIVTGTGSETSVIIVRKCSKYLCTIQSM